MALSPGVNCSVNSPSDKSWNCWPSTHTLPSGRDKCSGELQAEGRTCRRRGQAPLFSFTLIACGTETLNYRHLLSVCSVPGTVLNCLLPSSANEVCTAASLVPERNPAPTGSVSDNDFKVAMSNATDDGREESIEEGLPVFSQWNTLDPFPEMYFWRDLRSWESRVVSSRGRLRTRNWAGAQLWTLEVGVKPHTI